MREFLAIVWLELTALVRTRTVAMLGVAAVAWMAVFPHLVKGDGTEEGVRELTIHFSLGGVFALLVVALLASATASVAKERAERRLQLTMVRPVRYFAVVNAGAKTEEVALVVPVYSGKTKAIMQWQKLKLMI